MTIDELARKNSEYNELGKEINKAKAELKANGVGELEGYEYKAVIKERVTQSLDKDKALKIAKEIGAKWVIREIVDEEALEDSIASGEIDGSKFADCIVEKKNLAITFVKVKK